MRHTNALHVHVTKAVSIHACGHQTAKTDGYEANVDIACIETALVIHIRNAFLSLIETQC